MLTHNHPPGQDQSSSRGSILSVALLFAQVREVPFPLTYLKFCSWQFIIQVCLRMSRVLLYTSVYQITGTKYMFVSYYICSAVMVFSFFSSYVSIFHSFRIPYSGRLILLSIPVCKFSNIFFIYVYDLIGISLPTHLLGGVYLFYITHAGRRFVRLSSLPR